MKFLPSCCDPLVVGVGALLLSASVAAAASSPAGARYTLHDRGTGRRAAAAPGQPAADVTPPPGPFVRGAIGLEFGVGVLTEAWNLNAGREWLADGRLSFWWAFMRRTTLVVDVYGTRVFQESSRDAFVTGVAPGLRFQLVDAGRWALFSEIAVGPSWSDTAVPEGGTRFNYLGYAGLGASRRIGRQVHGVAGFRWLHLSNNGLEGHDHNPDIQALGGYAGVNVGF